MSLILEYLIPIKLILGFLPSQTLLSNARLKHLQGLVKAVKLGDVKMLNSEVEKFQTYYIDRGLFLVLDRLKLIGWLYALISKLMYCSI